jgi:hypothetical protein
MDPEPSTRYVLVVSDRPILTDWARQAFHGGKFKVVTVPSVKEGMQRLKRRWYDAVVVAAGPRGVDVSRLQSVLVEQYPDASLALISSMLPVNGSPLSAWGYHCVIICPQKNGDGMLRAELETLAHSTGEIVLEEGVSPP